MSAARQTIRQMIYLLDVKANVGNSVAVEIDSRIWLMIGATITEHQKETNASNPVISESGISHQMPMGNGSARMYCVAYGLSLQFSLDSVAEFFQRWPEQMDLLASFERNKK